MGLKLAFLVTVNIFNGYYVLILTKYQLYCGIPVVFAVF